MIKMAKTNVLEFIKNNITILDGATGTMLQRAGMKPGETSESWNLSHPEVLTAVHKAYYDAGSNIVSANTFGVNSLKYSHDEVEKLVSAAVASVIAAKEESSGKQEKFVALDIGSCGRLIEPFGDLGFEEAVICFADMIKAGTRAGADLIFIETMNTLSETKAALLAAKENSYLPVFVSNSYNLDGRLMTGTSPAAIIAMLEGMGADAIGINCSYGPKDLYGVIDEYLKYASVPVLFKPNAGLPKDENGKLVYDILPDEFAGQVFEKIKEGVLIVGGCCGTDPAYISALASAVKDIAPLPLTNKNLTVASSRSTAVIIGEKPLLIGERLNPTGKKRLKEALRTGDIGYLQNEAMKQTENGAHILDVNVGTPEVDEKALLPTVVREIQSVSDVPIQIDTSDPVAMENALRIYEGKAIINSVNGKQSSMDAVFPLAKKYGGVVVALTLDENGIPSTAEERFAIAEKILNEAKKYGLAEKDILFDTLTMAVSADSGAAKTTLDSLRMVSERLGCGTVLGVSNVSFGLPERETITSTFFSLALENGLSAAIMNPFSEKMKSAYHSFLTLRGYDPNCLNYIDFISSLDTPEKKPAVSETAADTPEGLKKAITLGQSHEASRITETLIPSYSPIDLINTAIIPALDETGKGFEEKRIFLPTLLLSAEAAGAAFEVIKAHSKKEDTSKKLTVVLATVEGDIHDIGKNIVKLLLENYGYTVVDLGKDVPPEKVVEETLRIHAPIVGLSALMTTTVPAMEKTIALLHKEAPWCKTVVGGAVLTEEYAMKIGADKYASDAMETVRYAEKFFSETK